MSIENTVIGQKFFDFVPRSLKHIENNIEMLKYPYPDLCMVCKHRNEASKSFCVNCVSNENTRATFFEYKKEE